MNINQAIDQCRLKYKILDIINIDIDQNELVQRLSSVKKDRYDTDERILIVQQNSDTYEYVDFAGTHLGFLQKACSTLDISNFFIIVITGNPDIKDELEQIRQDYSTDDLSMQYLIADVEYKKSIQTYPDTYCVHPWMHLFIGTTGDILPCCLADQNRPLGNIRESEISEIVKSPNAVKLKTNMINGYRSKCCNSCYTKEDNHVVSLRMKANRMFSEYISTDVQSFDPVCLDIRINNLCNFKCRTCSEWFSSAIADETITIYGKDNKLQYHNNISALTNSEKKLVFKKIVPYLSKKIKRIYFAGGEPLLIKEHYEILQHLIDISHTEVELGYNTNLSQLSYKGMLVTDQWKKFKNVTVGASIDASGKIAEYLRHGTVWNDILKNIDLIKNNCPHVDLKITSTVGLLNASNLIDLQQHWVEQKLFSPKNFEMSILTDPKFLSVATLPEHHKKKLSSKIQDHLNWCDQHNALNLKQHWINLQNFMANNNFLFAQGEFINRMKTLDHYRNESFEEIFEEYRDLYDELLPISKKF